jgi:NADH:ubiquinone oxidoreductase subunit E
MTASSKQLFDATLEWAEAVSRLPAAVLQACEQAREREHPESELIAILHAVQEAHGWLAPEVLDAVALVLGVPAATVSGVASFYHLFRLHPVGRFRISVCMGTACYVIGAQQVLSRLEQELGIDCGQTTVDLSFSLEKAHCVGTCALAPVIVVNDEVMGPVSAEQMPALLERLSRSRGHS